MNIGIIKSTFIPGKTYLDLTLKQTESIAKQVAEVLTKEDKVPYTITEGTLEESSFDLDAAGVKWDGGSYLIRGNGDVVNMAAGSGGVVYGKVNEEIRFVAAATILKS